MHFTYVLTFVIGALLGDRFGVHTALTRLGKAERRNRRDAIKSVSFWQR